MPSLSHKRGTRAQIDAAATGNALKTGEVYLITDEARLTVGTAANAHVPLAKQSEAGGGGSDPWIWQKLAVDVANSTTTLAVVTGLSFAASANTTYLVQSDRCFHSRSNDDGYSGGARYSVWFGNWPNGCQYLCDHIRWNRTDCRQCNDRSDLGCPRCQHQCSCYRQFHCRRRCHRRHGAAAIPQRSGGFCRDHEGQSDRHGAAGDLTQPTKLGTVYN